MKHKFALDFFDIFGNNVSRVENLNPPIIGRFRDMHGMVDVVAYSYENELATRLNIDMTIHRTVLVDDSTDDNQPPNYGMLEVMILGKHIANSPFMGFQVLPGPYDFNLSPMREFNILSSY